MQNAPLEIHGALVTLPLFHVTALHSQVVAFLALGATRWETTTKVVLPAARAGIIGAILRGPRS